MMKIDEEKEREAARKERGNEAGRDEQRDRQGFAILMARFESWP